MFLINWPLSTQSMCRSVICLFFFLHFMWWHLLLFTSNKFSILFCFYQMANSVCLVLMCSSACNACWLWTTLLLYPATAPPPSLLSSEHPTVCVYVSCHFPSGMERDSLYDLERSSDRRFSMKKPCYPQYRNRSLDYPPGTRCMYLFPFLRVGMMPMTCFIHSLSFCRTVHLEMI